MVVHLKEADLSLGSTLSGSNASSTALTVAKTDPLDSKGAASISSASIMNAIRCNIEVIDGSFEDIPARQLVTHYTRVREELVKRREALAGKVSEEYMDRMIQGLGHWIDAGNNGYLAWGILHFCKPA